MARRFGRYVHVHQGMVYGTLDTASDVTTRYSGIHVTTTHHVGDRNYIIFEIKKVPEHT